MWHPVKICFVLSHCPGQSHIQALFSVIVLTLIVLLPGQAYYNSSTFDSGGWLKTFSKARNFFEGSKLFERLKMVAISNT